MSVIVQVTIPATEVVLGDALVGTPGLRIRLERAVPLSEAVTPNLWVSAPDHDANTVATTLQADDDVASVRVLDTVEDEILIAVEWAANSPSGLFDVIDDGDGTVLMIAGEAEQWTLQLRFDDHEALHAFYRQCCERGIFVDVRRVHRSGVRHDTGMETKLTDKQREALVVALDEGYFDVPRRANLVELGERLEISDTATSQRLNRGLATVLSSSLRDDDWQQPNEMRIE